MNDTAIDRRPSIAVAARRFAFPSQTAFLSQAALLEEAGPPRVPALICLLGFAFVAIAIAAGMMIRIDVVTSSAGGIVAAEGNAVLQSFDGGIVDRIEVEAGQVVEAGDIMLTLKDPEGEAQLEQLILREAALFVQVRLLRQLVDLPTAEAAQGLDRPTAIIAEQMSILGLEEDALISERALVRAEIERQSEALRNSRALENSAVSRLSLIQDKLLADRQLYAKGLLAKAQLLEIEQQALDATSELTELRGRIREAEASLAESERRLDNAIAGRKQTKGGQLSAALIDLNETRQHIKTMRKRLQRSAIKAPVRGIVMELKVRHQGQIVAPGDAIAEIVPIDSGLIAEIRLPPSEISHVHPGLPVRMAIDGIEPHRHGYLEGEVAAISPSTFIDDNGLPYYRTSIILASDHLNGMPLIPGMTLQAQAKTGHRTILEYLLKPVYRAWETAFRER